MQKHIKQMIDSTDLYPWYWYSYGEKCYAFATVEAFPADEKDECPKPGTELKFNESGNLIGENGVKMFIISEIANIKYQNGNTICSFIAMAHAELMKEYIT